ncbi:cytochrome c3 family protein [Polyangium sorediatum]|uniref:Cytochrome c3 family protein n=1 Tax=Polyangium sorediatum TaxID=889274 RepID=A0ABT6P5T0_9BACT|nr:cytochrome c3 family protein [Polyangium sorediatum]MDI1435989.1 cytochrome c3 family protein [Polyangium sorediatum]
MVATKHLALVFALALSGVAAACGGGSTPPPDTANDQKTDGSSTDKPADPGGATDAKPEGGDAKPGDAKPADTGTGGTAATPPAAAGKPSTNLRQSQLLEDIKKIGLAPDKLQDLPKIGLAQKKKLMPLFQKALGYKDCNGCHVEGDFKAETRKIKITRGMWKNFVVGLRDEKGGALFCDSCHDGNEHVLNHADKKALETFMDEQYEDKLTRADKKDMECGTCHGDPFEGDIITKVWGIAKK